MPNKEAENRPSVVDVLGSPPLTIDVISAPDSFDALYEQYHGFVCGLLVKLGIQPQNVEDVADDIFLRFYVTDILGQFDGSLVFSRTSGKYRARFKSFLSAKVEHYARGKRGRQAVISVREPLICDTPIGETGTPWIDVFGNSLGASSVDDQTGVEAWELAVKIRAHLSSLPVRGKRDLVKLFDLICRQLAEGADKPNRKELAEEFGVSDTAIGSMIVDLRQAVSTALETV